MMNPLACLKATLLQIYKGQYTGSEAEFVKALCYKLSEVCPITREGFCESRRCSRDTHPESYVTEYTQYRKKMRDLH